MLVLVLAVWGMGRAVRFCGDAGAALVWVALLGARCPSLRGMGVERSVSASDGLSGVGWHVWACSG